MSRRPNAETDIRGLYIAGSSTAWGPSVEGAMISGVQAASAVTGRNLIHEISRGTVFGDQAGLPADLPNWDPLQASKGFGRKTQNAAELASRT
jgi:flavin-dependent amine oxidoreductase